MKSWASSLAATGSRSTAGLPQCFPPRPGSGHPGLLGRPVEAHLRAKIRIQAYDRAGLLNEITAIFKEESINLLDASAVTARKDNMALITATMRCAMLSNLAGCWRRSRRLPNVQEVRRQKG